MKFYKTKRGWATGLIHCVFAAVFSVLCLAQISQAQSFQISSVAIDGNRRIETATIRSFTGIEVGAFMSISEVNEAVQRVRGSDLFESVTADITGSELKITVVEFPTVNLVAFEGNDRLGEGQLKALVRTVSRRVYSVSQVRDDANSIAAAYANQGRISASVEPRIIRRSDNRVDVVFEIIEGAVVEIERISFVGNRTFSDSRLRRILNTKQAGFLRLFIQRDTFIEDRIEFDKRVLKDFYNSRGYVDFRTLSVNSELSKTRDSFFVTFQVQEGQQFSFGKITTSSDLSNVVAEEFARAIKTVEGKVYTPDAVENTIARMERQALELGLDFVRVEPRVTRNNAELTLDVDYVLSRGPRVFVERIDIAGNTTTLDRVIRRQFKIVEGDALNPREIRASAERIRSLGFFGATDVTTREGSAPNQIVVNVAVMEKPTGSLKFGANYNSANGVGLVASFREANFLGRGQDIGVAINTTSNTQTLRFSFKEPAISNRDLSLNSTFNYQKTDANNAKYDTDTFELSSVLGFPVSKTGLVGVKGFYESELLTDVTTNSEIIKAEAAQGRRSNFGLGYDYSFDNRRTGLNPKAGTFLRFSQDFALSGSDRFVRTNLKWGGEAYMRKEDLKLSAVLETGALTFSGGSTSRVTDRYFLSSNLFRGFAAGGLGPREVGSNDALAGNYYAVARFETQFPKGLPEEYGIDFGAFVDVGSVWGLGSGSINAATAGGTSVEYDGFTLRAVVGFTIFWTTPIGPLRFNFTDAVKKAPNDVEQSFDLTISTLF